jgi:endonuclease YncB( thermonuclease family)
MPIDAAWWRGVCCGFALLLPAIPSAQNIADANEIIFEGKVISILDGDTLEALVDGRPARIRLHGVDAPELTQDHGDEARAALHRLVAERRLRVAAIDIDRYHRLVAVVEVEGNSVNEKLLTAGIVWAYRDYLGQTETSLRYCAIEGAARDARLGLWHQPPERWDAPWDYRARQRNPRLTRGDWRAESVAACLAAVRDAPPADERRQRIEAFVDALPPRGCLIKGNVSGSGARIYHLPGSAAYAATRIDTIRGEHWFCDESEAAAAGFRRAR